uniref:Uncharacterized protein n=1 Tax=Rhizophora mucronata TaxID=61149 RepID=A0A2P2MYV4_RHIMU
MKLCPILLLFLVPSRLLYHCKSPKAKILLIPFLVILYMDAKSMLESWLCTKFCCSKIENGR